MTAHIVVLLIICAVSLVVLAVGTLVFGVRNARLTNARVRAEMEKRAYERLLQDHEWKTALMTRRGITPIEGGKEK